MFSQKKESKTVIKITDTEISYLTLTKNKLGFFVENFEMIDLPSGIITRGEILKADVFSNIIKKMKKNFTNTSIDLLLEHDYFLCNDGLLDSKTSGKDTKKRIKDYFNSLSKTESWQKTHVCEFESFSFGKQDTVMFTCLPKDVQKSYIHVLKKSGLRVNSINSELLVFNHLLNNDQTSLVYVDNTNTRIIDFKKGMYVGHKTFQVSYDQFTDDIVKNVSLDKKSALKILQKYGVLRTHKDEQVYKRLIRSLTPLLDFFKKRKVKASSDIYVVYKDMPIPGLADALSQSAGSFVKDLDIFNFEKYTFQDILQLHKNDSYKYQSHIAQALRSWKK